MLIYQYKNKGILVPVYGISCFVGFGLLLGELQRNIGGFFTKINFAYASTIALIVAGVWTYFTCEVYYKDREGNKKVVELKHEFYWIKMRYWAYIFWGMAALVLISTIAD